MNHSTFRHKIVKHYNLYIFNGPRTSSELLGNNGGKVNLHMNNVTTTPSPHDRSQLEDENEYSNSPFLDHHVRRRSHFIA